MYSPTPGASLALRVTAVGYFKDFGREVAALPLARLIGPEEGAARVVELKKKLNELQKKRERYHKKQIANAAAGAAAAVFTLGSSLVVAGGGAAHQRNRLHQIVAIMREVIDQINQVRTEFQMQPGFDDAQAEVEIDMNVFKHGLERNELVGKL